MFNGVERAFEIEPGNALEAALLDDINKQCEKGSAKLEIKKLKVASADQQPKFRFELVQNQ
jgi:hypothetical protein